MGGKKKLTIKQMQKSQTKKSRELKPKERKTSKFSTEKGTSGITLPDLRSKKTLSELKKVKALTPSTVASHFEIRLSIARDLLEELERREILEYVSGSKNLKIYKHRNSTSDISA